MVPNNNKHMSLESVIRSVIKVDLACCCKHAVCKFDGASSQVVPIAGTKMNPGAIPSFGTYIETRMDV